MLFYYNFMAQFYEPNCFYTDKYFDFIIYTVSVKNDCTKCNTV